MLCATKEAAMILLLLLSACDVGTLLIPDHHDVDVIDGFMPDTDATTDADTDTEDTDPEEAVVVIRCVDVDAGSDRTTTVVVPDPGPGWARVLPPRVLTWRGAESCWDGDAAWTAGAEGAANAYPDGSPGDEYTITVTTPGIPCGVDVPISLVWTVELRNGDTTVYASTGSTTPRCS